MIEKRKVGRPIKYGNESRVDTHISLSQEAKTKIKLSGKSASYFTEFGIRALLDDPEEKALNEINERLAVLEPEYFELKAKKIRIEEMKKQMDEIRREKEMQEKYMHTAFSEIIGQQKKHGKIVIKMSWIEEVYGIFFDVALVNRNFEGTLNDLNLPPAYVVEKYHIEKMRKGSREEKMMVEIVRKESDNIGGEV